VHGASPIPLRGPMDRKPRAQTQTRLIRIEADLSCHSNAYYRPHSHSGLTTHLIIKGSLTIIYPGDRDAEKTTYGVGDRIDVDAGREHEVWIGPEGCTYVIGE